MRHMEGVILLSRLMHSLGVIHYKEGLQFYHVYFRLQNKYIVSCEKSNQF